MRNLTFKWMILAPLLYAAMPAAHAQRSEAEERLRQMLKQTTIELRDAHSQNAELRAKVDELNAQRTVTPAAPAQSSGEAALRRAQREAQELRESLAEARSALAEQEQTSAHWKQAYEQAEQLAHTRDADAKRFDESQQQLGQRASVCERDNAELVGIAEEILQRYKNKGVWAALRDAEPVTGIHRVQLETLAQKYHARILDLQAPAAAN